EPTDDLDAPQPLAAGRVGPAPRWAGRKLCHIFRGRFGGAVDAFLEAHAALILRLARSFAKAGNPIDANDVAQEVLVSLLHADRSGSFDPARLTSVEGYLRVVVRNAVQRGGARGARSGRPGLERDVADAELATAAPSPEEVTEHALDARRKLEALKGLLRPRDAIACAMLVEDGMSIEEVARALG